jgi:hypothetical protein
MKSSKERLDLVVVIPLGPNDTAVDTIESIQTYCGQSHVIVVVDDTKNKRTEQKLKALGDDVRVVTAPQDLPSGTYGGLYMKTLAALRWVEDNFVYKTALRLDTDSLVVGFYPEKDAINMFKKSTKYGLLGSYKRDCNNNLRDTSGVVKRLLAEIYLGWLMHPNLSLTLYKIRRVAKRNGYIDGDHCLGAAIFMRPEFVKALVTNDTSSNKAMRYCGLGDDHIYGLMASYLGFRQVDFAPDPLPLGISGHGLPDTPANLLKRRKKIVHSIKPDNISIRRYFKKLRIENSAQTR